MEMGRGQGQRDRSASATAARPQPDDSNQWTEVTNDVHVEPFAVIVGPNIPISALIFDIFRLFFTASLIDIIVLIFMLVWLRMLHTMSSGQR